VTCPDCQSVFRVDPAKVPAAGVRARCSVCGGVISVARSTGTPARGVGTVTPPVSHEGRPPHTPAQPTTPSGTETSSRPTPAHVAAVAARDAAPSPEPAAAAAPTARIEPPTAEPDAEPVREPLWTSPGAVPAVRFPAVPPHAATASESPAEPSPAPRIAPEAPRRRPVNPYLSNDPAHKARRLARALVSDLVAYHPQRREEGLRTGSLKQLFRDEIRKSYEEYVEQVGTELAEATPYFRDALNDVLAGGRKVF
jgi:predicted Zn finger-like uncharacterized protein